MASNGRTVRYSDQQAKPIRREDFTGKQSVRTTFTLFERTITLLGVASALLGIKQKSLLDQLLEDATLLSRLAGQAPEIVTGIGTRRKKTYVISRNSLKILDTVAAEKGVPRDMLVEISVQRLVPVIDLEKRKHRMRQDIYEQALRIAEQASKLEKKAERLVGRDDRASRLLNKMAAGCRESTAHLAAMIENGTVLDDLSMTAYEEASGRMST